MQQKEGVFMKICRFTERQFQRLKQYELPREVINTEAKLYITKKNNEKKLLKRYFLTEGKYFSNKMLTVSLLIDKGESLGIDRLILPTELAVVEDHVVGHMMPFIENNENVGVLLRSSYLTTEEKKELLKKVGKLVMSVIHRYPNTGFLFGDLHEGNFILNKDDNEVYAVDLDGAKIGNNEVMGMKYCDNIYELRRLPNKYTKEIGDFVEPSINTELFCYSYMVLGMLYGKSITSLSLQEFYSYLQYLSDIGYAKELIDIFANLYTPKDNYFPLDAIDLIPNNTGKANYNVYQKIKK